MAMVVYFCCEKYSKHFKLHQWRGHLSVSVLMGLINNIRNHCLQFYSGHVGMSLSHRKYIGTRQGKYLRCFLFVSVQHCQFLKSEELLYGQILKVGLSRSWKILRNWFYLFTTLYGGIWNYLDHIFFFPELVEMKNLSCLSTEEVESDIRLFNYWRRSWDWRGAAAGLLFSLDWRLIQTILECRGTIH